MPRVVLFADVQYADADDGSDFKKTRHRRYRNALDVLRRALADAGPADAYVNLGDLIDGRAAKSDLQTVLELLPRGSLHVRGNHELYVFSPEELRENGLFPDDGGSFFYARNVGDTLRVIVLDSYDVSVLNRDARADDECYAMLATHNPNDLRSACDWSEGLAKDKKRFLPYNGGFGPAQLEWFERQLAECRAEKRRAIVCTHVPIHPKAASATCLAFNFEEVLALTDDKYDDVVAAVFAGHDHDGGEHGKHKTLRGMVEAEPGAVGLHVVFECP